MADFMDKDFMRSRFDKLGILDFADFMWHIFI